LSYSIDQEGRLQMVDDRWLPFACANGAPQLTPAAVLGRHIQDFVAEPTTRYIYGLLYERVRRGATLRLPFRCDAPEVRRDMILQLSPAGSGGVQCDTFLLDEKPHSPIVLLDAASPRGNTVVVMCSWCKRIRQQGRWLDLEEGVQAFQLLSRSPLPEISHGMCPSCIDTYYPVAEGPTEESGLREPPSGMPPEPEHDLSAGRPVLPQATPQDTSSAATGRCAIPPPHLPPAARFFSR